MATRSKSVTLRAAPPSREPTEAEFCLWSRLRNGQIMGLEFEQRRTMGAYTVDFYCPRARLVVEADDEAALDGAGGIDDRRDRMLSKLGIKVLRYDADLIVAETDAVAADIEREARARL